MNDQWHPMPRYKLRKNLIKFILKKENLAGKSSLEIGYGSGDMLITCAKMGLSTYGYDFSKDAFQSAVFWVKKQSINKERINILTKEDDIYLRKYDYIFLFEVLEHIKDDIDALISYKKILKANGKIILSVPAHMNKWGRNDECSGHYRRYEKKELKEKLSSAGFNTKLIWNYAFPLSLLLDPMLHMSHGKKSYKEKLSKDEQTKISGVKRKNDFFIRFVSSDVFILPFCLIQRLFFNTDLGSSYIAVGRQQIISNE